jgi:hypothetical protein
MADGPKRDLEPELLPDASARVPIPPWARELVRLLDSALRVPGTDFRVGLDALIGLIFPGGGDAVGAVPALLILGLALRHGVPPVIVLRMLLNIGLDALLGAVPLLGDLFDAAFRANEKNLALLEKHGGASRRPGVTDYLVVGGAMLVVVVLALLPIVLVGLALEAIFSG